jgi:hypothetical protein
MPLEYCPQHERLWIAPLQGWITRPRREIQQLHHLYLFFAAFEIATPEYQVLVVRCDHCDGGSHAPRTPPRGPHASPAQRRTMACKRAPHAPDRPRRALASASTPS